MISCAFGISCYGLQAVFNTVECAEFVSRALAQLWNALAGQVQMVQFSDFAVLVWSASHVCPPGSSLSPEQCRLGVLFASPLLC